MFEQLNDTKPTMPMWQVWAELILGTLNLMLAVLSELRHDDHIFSLVWVANGVLFLFAASRGWLRMRKGRK
jgi:hypothetical protein